MKKIAIFQRDLSMGGIQKSLVNLLNNIDYDKYKVDLYLFDDNNFFGDKLPSRLNVIYLKGFNYFSRFIYFSLLKKIHRFDIKEEYDLVIDYNGYDQACALACVNTKAKKHIMWVHNDVVRERKNDIKYRILRHFFKSKYKYFDEFICVSNGLIDPFKTLNKIKHDNFTVIPNLVISSEIIEKSKEKIDIKIDDSKYNLVSVGRLVLQKGFDILINDMKYIVTKRDDIHLYIIGDGSEREKLENLVKNNNLTEYITFLGSKSNPFKYESKMDGFILESRYEGQGIVILEAKILGLDLVIPDRLSSYIEGIEFTNDVCESVLSLKKKKNKKVDYLDDYNNDVIDRINNLFEKN